MAYPTEKEILEVGEPPTWIDRHFLRQDPFAFETAGLSFSDVACDFAEALDVERNGIFCIGSGAVGWSTSPVKMRGGRLKHFDEHSDLDLAIISARHFEDAWRELLRATQPHIPEVAPEIQANLSWQRKRLFDGAILSNKLLTALSFGPHWRGTVDRIGGRLADALDRNVSIEVWIYRDYWSLRNYVARGIVMCQTKARIEGGE